MSDLIIVENTDVVAVETPVELLLETSGPQGPAGPSATWESLSGKPDVLIASGGALNPDAALTASTTPDGADRSTDTEFGGWGFGVEEKIDGTNTGKQATLEPDGFHTADGSGNSAHLSPTGLLLGNGSKLQKGTTDAGLGGNGGIALRCSLDYELKWDAGRLFVMAQDGFTIRRVEYCGVAVPSANDDSTKGFVVGSLWILDDGTVYECTDNAVEGATWVEAPGGSVTYGTAAGTATEGNDARIANIKANSISTLDGVASGEYTGGIGGSIDISGGNPDIG
ncbi:hypothetical protein EBZ80_24520, partial [bacterium]|nr:hypothetical protein [bacterium]